MVNITFQVHSSSALIWPEEPIIYVLENVPEDKDIEDILHAISVVLNFKEVRTARLFLNDPITVRNACKVHGEFYMARQTFYNKPRT
jgi:hypothetical protein